MEVKHPWFWCSKEFVDRVDEFGARNWPPCEEVWVGTHLCSKDMSRRPVGLRWVTYFWCDSESVRGEHRGFA